MFELDWAMKEIDFAKEGKDRRTSHMLDEVFDVYKHIYRTNISNLEFVRCLIRLLQGKPVAPLYDADDQWEDLGIGRPLYFHKRYPILWKEFDEDGNPIFKDTNRVIAIDETSTEFVSSSIIRYVHDIFPIVFPYTPETEQFVVHVEKNDGGYQINYIITPDHKALIVNDWVPC